MTTEILTAPGAAVEVLAPDLSQQTPDVAAPEEGKPPQEERAEPETLTAEQRLEKERANFQRRMDRKHQRDAQAIADARAEARQLREQLERTQPKPAEGEEQQQFDPAKVQELIQREAARLASVQSLKTKVSSIVEQGQKATPNFDALCNTVSEEFAFYGEDGAPTAFTRAVMDADKPHALLAHLGQNPDLLEDLHGLTEGQLARRLDRIEQQLSKPAPKPSNAPTPLSPVRGSSGGGDPSAESDDFMAHKLKTLRGR